MNTDNKNTETEQCTIPSVRLSLPSQNEIDELKNDGWIFIPNGAAWGLAEAPYLAKNIQYSCVAGSGGTNGGDGGSSSGGSNGSSSSSSSNPVSQGVGQILALEKKIKELKESNSSGNEELINFLVVSGLPQEVALDLDIDEVEAVMAVINGSKKNG